MKRQEMLTCIRNALDKKNLTPTNSEFDIKRRLTERRADLKHTADSTSSSSNSSKKKSIRFMLEAKKNGTIYIEVEDKIKIPSKVKSEFSEISAPHFFIRCFHQELLDLPWSKAGLSVEAGALSSEDKVGMSSAHAGIAETGTVMLISSPSNPSSLAFLPEIHIVILKQSRIFCTLEDAFADLLNTQVKRPLPHSINLISGASRTGDIGGHIVHGAHGPVKLAVVLINNE